MSKQNYILWFDQISQKNLKLVGGKNASIGEMYNALTSRGIKVPFLKGIAIGKVKVLYSPEQMSEFKKGEILVTEITNPDWEPIVSRELGIPAIVGVKNALDILKDGVEITINCADGEEGYIYEGYLKYEVEEINLENLRRPKTKIMMNVGNPTEAFRHALIPNDGVGPARMEFIYANWIQIHPLALKIVREEMGFKNVKVMIPFCRTPEEGLKVLKIMEDVGYGQHKNGLEVYVMAEIPSNIILADEFAQIFDGFSIGSNDLTQLTLGVDRDSSLVDNVFDERNKTAKKYNKKVGICGQAPSDYPEIVEFLVRNGIDSISLILVLEIEDKL